MQTGMIKEVDFIMHDSISHFSSLDGIIASERGKRDKPRSKIPSPAPGYLSAKY